MAAVLYYPGYVFEHLFLYALRSINISKQNFQKVQKDVISFYPCDIVQYESFYISGML